MSKPWPTEVNKFIVANAQGRSCMEIVELINRQGFDKKYGMTFTCKMIKTAKSRMHIRSGTKGGNPKGYSPVYPEGMLEYIRSIATGKSTKEIVIMVNNKYGEGTIDARRIKSYMGNHGIVTGIDTRFKPGQVPYNKGKTMSPEVYAKVAATMFKKGHVPANHKNVGEYSHTTEGYLIRKVQEQGTYWERWELVHRAVWEEHNGLVPDGKKVSFLDGDKDNCDIRNLVLIDNDVNLEMNHSRLRSKDAEITKTGVALASLKVSIRKKQRENT